MIKDHLLEIGNVDRAIRILSDIISPADLEKIKKEKIVT